MKVVSVWWDVLLLVLWTAYFITDPLGYIGAWSAAANACEGTFGQHVLGDYALGVFPCGEQVRLFLMHVSVVSVYFVWMLRRALLESKPRTEAPVPSKEAAKLP